MILATGLKVQKGLSTQPMGGFTHPKRLHFYLGSCREKEAEVAFRRAEHYNENR